LSVPSSVPPMRIVRPVPKKKLTREAYTGAPRKTLR
jgi:hypothetical protein